MKKVISILRDDCDIECLPNERFSLDVEMFPENGNPPRMPSRHTLFENPEPREPNITVPDLGTSSFRYFLDGSQRSYRVIDAQFGTRYLPICAGQVGVAVMERCPDGSLRPVREHCHTQNLLVMPEAISEETRAKIEEAIRLALDPWSFSVVLYKVKGEEEDPGDTGRAKVIQEMQMLELRTIRDLIRGKRIGGGNLLAKDGSLQYRDTKIKDLELREDIVQLRNVVGISKSFRPDYTIGRGRGKQDLGNLVKNLEFKQRSVVVTPDKAVDNINGWWYLRVRPRQWMQSALQGILKLEVFAVNEEEKSDGISGERADTLSSYALAERNVTPYGTDKRWASHLYPIFLAETYLKASFISDERFKSFIF